MITKPILMSGPMVRAILREIEEAGGGKTMTRRLVWRYEGAVNPAYDEDLIRKPTIWKKLHDRVQAGEKARLWVRENHRFRGGDYGDSDGEIEWFRCYGEAGAADNWDPDFPAGWEPSLNDRISVIADPDEQEDGVVGYVTKLHPFIHMPKWASRLTLEVSGTKMERLDEISEDDCIAEGCPAPDASWFDETDEESRCERALSARCAFAALWDSLHGPGAWEANPEVVAISFKPRLMNIERLSA